ncbi:MAG: ABC transporter ATP-binding protein [Candidatus Woesearchaeota archaeon]
MATASALREHIMQAIARGAQRKDLEKLLVSAGWPKEIVDEYLGEAQEAVLPKGPALVRLRGVTKRFGNNVVLDHVDLDIPPGELFGIIGLSGVGKTTLLNTIVGFIKPDEGEVLLQLPDKREVSVLNAKDAAKRMFGFAAQVPSFYGKLSVRENIEHFAALYNIPPGERISKCDSLLRLVGLESAQHTLAQNLSGGMQKRLDIACAIVHDPSILILDEPTADLDPIIRDQIWALLVQINKQGTTVIVASHVVSELEQYCNRIAILRNHKITEVGTTTQLRDIYSKQYEIFLRTDKEDYPKIKAFCSRNRKIYSRMAEKEDCFVAQTSKPHEALKQLLAFLAKSRISVTYLRVDRPSIAEVFASLVKNDTHPLH